MSYRSSHVFEIARHLRKNETKAEKLLWRKLRNRRLGGFKFLRQHPIKGYVVDFYCHEVRLVVELEGTIHDLPSQKTYDEERFKSLRSRKLDILRFRNDAVMEDVDSVLRQILHCVRRPHSPPSQGPVPLS